MTTLDTILLIFALVLAILAALPVNSRGYNLLAAAFAFYIASLIF